MAQFPVYVYVDFLDAAERTATVGYRLLTQFDDTLDNFAAIETEADALVTALNVLTWSAIPAYRIQVEKTGAGAANVSANNQIRAFTRTVLANGEKSSFEVPAWDDLVYDQDSNNLLSAAYNTAADVVRDLLADPESGSSMDTISFTQSRTHKSRNVLS